MQNQRVIRSRRKIVSARKVNRESVFGAYWNERNGSIVASYIPKISNTLHLSITSVSIRYAERAR